MPSTKLHPRLAVLLAAGLLPYILCACMGELENAPASPVSGSQDPSQNSPDGLDPEFGPGGECDMQALMALPENGCTNAGCHGAQYQGALDLLSPGLARRLTGVSSQTEACNGQLLIDPEDRAR